MHLKKMKICQYKKCGLEIEKTSPRANNKKFCDVTCRDNHYRETGLFKKARDKSNHKRYSRYEEGKEKCVICEKDGEEAWYWAICHHAAFRHGVSHVEYKKMIGVDIGKGRIPEALKKRKRKHVFENGTVENLKKGAKYRYKKGDTRAGRYQRSPETLARLRGTIKVE